MKNFSMSRIKKSSAIELASRMRIMMEIAAKDDETQGKTSMADALEVEAIDAELMNRLAKSTTFEAKEEIMQLIRNPKAIR